MTTASSGFPGGTYRISRAENEELCAAVGAVPDPEGWAHPIFYYIATQVGMGLSVAELLAKCDFDVADGPLMVGSNATFHQQLKVDLTYEVSGQIDSLVRKPSRAFGAMDLLTFTLKLTEGGTPVLTCTNQWVLPRRGGSEA